MLKEYIDARESAAAEALYNVAMGEARALLAGVSPELAREVGITRVAKPRKCGPNLTDANTVAVNAQGHRLPHNARGVVVPGSKSRRSKTKAVDKARTFQCMHAAYIDRIRKDVHELSRLIAQYRTSGCRKRKALKAPMRAVFIRLSDSLDKRV